MPLIEPPPLTERIDWAKHWIDSLYQTDGNYGYIKEFPAFPLNIYVRDTDDHRFSGDWIRRDTGSIPVSKISKMYASRLGDADKVGLEDYTDGDYDEPLVTVWRDYSDNGVTTYNINFEKFGGMPSTYTGKDFVDVYTGDQILWYNIGYNTPSGTQTKPPGASRVTVAGMRRQRSGGYTGMTPPALRSFTWTVDDWRGMPCNRYTVRHASRLGYFMYLIWGDVWRASSLQRLRSDYGFTYDIYDPVFGISPEQPDDMMFTKQAYADTFDVWLQLPRGLYPHRFPYLSKVNRSATTREAYILQSYGDSLLKMLQAIHMLNRYGDPNHEYWTKKKYGIEDILATPLSVARGTVPDPWTEDPQASNMWSYNQGGILHPSDSSVVSGVRTAVWSILTTLLAYRYNVSEFYWIADHVYNSLTGNFKYGDGSRAPQAGLFPFSPGWIETEDNGQLLRPPYRGAFYNLWKRGAITDIGPLCYGTGGTDGVQPCTHVNVVAVDRASSFLTDLADRWNMPSEDSGPIVSNPETTILMIQALRVYAYYALNTLFPRIGIGISTFIP